MRQLTKTIGSPTALVLGVFVLVAIAFIGMAAVVSLADPDVAQYETPVTEMEAKTAAAVFGIDLEKFSLFKEVSNLDNVHETALFCARAKPTKKCKPLGKREVRDERQYENPPEIPMRQARWSDKKDNPIATFAIYYERQGSELKPFAPNIVRFIRRGAVSVNGAMVPDLTEPELFALSSATETAFNRVWSGEQNYLAADRQTLVGFGYGDIFPLVSGALPSANDMIVGALPVSENERARFMALIGISADAIPSDILQKTNSGTFRFFATFNGLGGWIDREIRSTTFLAEGARKPILIGRSNVVREQLLDGTTRESEFIFDQKTYRHGFTVSTGADGAFRSGQIQVSRKNKSTLHVDVPSSVEGLSAGLPEDLRVFLVAAMESYRETSLQFRLDSVKRIGGKISEVLLFDGTFNQQLSCVPDDDVRATCLIAAPL